jgi:hypothetical protein
MLHHISIAANQPQQVAEILAEFLQGQAIPFPFHEGSFIALSFDPYGTMIEVLPQGSEFKPGENTWAASARPQASLGNAFHAAISVALSETQIHQIAQRAGWRVETCDRNGFFHIIEVWVENQQLLEFLPPTFTAEYLAAAAPEALKELIAATPTLAPNTVPH